MMTSAVTSKNRRKSRPVRTGLALAGGGPLGAVYEIGALLALEEALQGIQFNDIDIYVGVSSGGFIASGLANGIDIATIYHSFIESETAEHALTPDLFMRPAFGEFVSRALGVPQLLLEGLRGGLAQSLAGGAVGWLAGLSRSLPVGIFDSDAIGAQLSRLFAAHGGTDDFRKLAHRLYLVATDLDSAESVRFGAPGYDHVPISRAVQASAALPGLFPPVLIDGHHYVDGALIKTLHASVALEQDAKLVICINPLVPFDAHLAARNGRPRHQSLVKGGLPAVMSQTFRALIHSRMTVGMSKYEKQFPGADVMLFQPDRDDAEMFFANVFSYSSRHRLCEHAYQGTRTYLLKQHASLRPVLARHGIELRLDVLRDPHRRAAGRLRRRSAETASNLRADQAGEPARALDAALGRLEQWMEAR